MEPSGRLALHWHHKASGHNVFQWRRCALAYKLRDLPLANLGEFIAATRVFRGGKVSSDLWAEPQPVALSGAVFPIVPSSAGKTLP